MKQSDWSGPCACMGPQNGDPVCPCQMRGVQIQNGRYVRIQDLGPAPDASELERRSLLEKAAQDRLSQAFDAMRKQWGHDL